MGEAVRNLNRSTQERYLRLGESLEFLSANSAFTGNSDVFQEVWWIQHDVDTWCAFEYFKQKLQIFPPEEIGNMSLFFYSYWWVGWRIYLEILGDTCTSTVFIKITHLDCLDLWIHTSSYNVQYVSKQSSLCLHNMFYPLDIWCMTLSKHLPVAAHTKVASFTKLQWVVVCTVQAMFFNDHERDGYTEWELQNEDLIVNWFGDAKSIFLLISVGYQ